MLANSDLTLHDRKPRIMPHFSASMLSVGTTPTRKQTIRAKRKKRNPIITRMFLFRCLMGVTLLAAATICGLGSYYVLEANETTLYTSEYNSISSNALDSAIGNLERMSDGAELMARTLSEEYPYSSMWPNVAYRGFHGISETLLKLSTLEGVGFVPLVEPFTEAPDWEDFAYEHFASDPDTPAGAGISSFGEGIFGYNPLLPTIDQRYHDQFGLVFSYTSLYTTMAPLFQVAVTGDSDIQTAAEALVMYNLHLDPSFGPRIDEVIDCAAATDGGDCSAITDIISNPIPSLFDPDPEPYDTLSLFFHPVYPRYNNTELVALAGGFVSWSTVLKDVVADSVDGLDFIVETDTKQYTYRVNNGKVKFVGEGDHHDDTYDDFKETRKISLFGAATSTKIKYQFKLYPREDFFKQYVTNSPLYGLIISVLIILITSMIFVIYDAAVKFEDKNKQNVLDTKRKFVRFISHEIRTPLNTVKLGLTLLETELSSLIASLSDVPPEAMMSIITAAVVEWAELTNDILNNSESAVIVLDDMLNYDKVEMGTLRLEWGAVFPWDVVKKVFKAFALASKQKDIVLEMEVERWKPAVSRQRKAELDLLRIVGDDTRLAQVLRNFVSNAIKFTPNNGTVTITAVWDPHGLTFSEASVPEQFAPLKQYPRCGSMRVSVKDTGAGLSEDQLKEIFAEGVQFNANMLQAGGGSGLGLYISKGIVEQHGGYVSVSSEGLNKGTTFSFELPLYKYPTGVMPRQASVLSAASDSSRKGGISPKRIFLVDDAVSNRKLLNRLLTKKGHDCVEAEDGQMAVDMFVEGECKGEYFDVILMDFEMPRLNGPIATQQIRELGCSCLIVGVTGNMLPEDVQYFLDCGADVVLPKPLHLEKFEEALRNFREDKYLYRDIDNAAAAAASSPTAAATPAAAASQPQTNSTVSGSTSGSDDTIPPATTAANATTTAAVGGSAKTDRVVGFVPLSAKSGSMKPAARQASYELPPCVPSAKIMNHVSPSLKMENLSSRKASNKKIHPSAAEDGEGVAGAGGIDY